MDVKEYISSGILEAYVLGACSEQESKEVECMSHIYPEIKQELISLQQQIEKFSNQNSISPPAYVKRNILMQINSEKRLQIPKLNNSKGNYLLLKYGMAASILFLIVTIVIAIYINNKLLISENKIVSLTAENNTIKKENYTLDSIIQQKIAALNMLTASENEIIPLYSAQNKPEQSEAVIFWNKKAKDVCLSIKYLPAPPENKQYQLWAIANNTPVDLGVFEINSKDEIFLMKKTDNPDAFAITLEPKGGSINPTLNEMYVIGKVDYTN